MEGFKLGFLDDLNVGTLELGRNVPKSEGSLDGVMDGIQNGAVDGSIVGLTL